MKNTNDKPKKFGQKKSKASGLAIAFASLLGLGALAGTGVSVWHISKNYTESSEFTKSVSARVKVDPWKENDSIATKKDKNVATERISSAAKKFSEWLKNCGNASYDVSYEVVGEQLESETVYYGYLSTQFPLDKVKTKHPGSKEEEDKKIENDAYLSYFANNGFNTNNKSLVYRWYDAGASINTAPQFSVVPFTESFIVPTDVKATTNKTKVIADKDGKYGIAYQTDAASSVKLNDIYKNLNDALTDSKKEDKEGQKPEAIKNSWGQPRLYIINNLEGMLNEANYHIANYVANNTTLNYKEIYEGTNYAKFAQNYYEQQEFSKGKRQSKDHNHLFSATSHETTTKQLDNFDLFNFIDSKTAGTIDSDSAFASKYVEQTITYSNFETVMPEKINDDYKNNVSDKTKPEINYFWLGKSSKTLAEQYLENEVKYGFKEVKLVNISYKDISSEAETGANSVLSRFRTEYSKKDIAPSFTECLFGKDNLVAWLSLGFLLFLIALLVILACLYRTTGVFSWITLMFALAMTGLIATIGSSVISLSLLFGLFIMAFAGFIGCLSICGRMKRRLALNEDTPVVIRKTFRKSLLPLVDISVITLVFGVCFTYVAPISLNSLGLILIIGAFLNFISVFLLNGLLHALCFNNRLTFNTFAFLGKPSMKASEALAQSNPLVPNSLDATKLDFAYYSGMSKKKLNATGKRALIALIVVACILVAGVIVFSVLGFTSSTMFHTSTCVAIKFDGDIFAQSWFTGANLSYTSYKSYDGWYYFYTNADVTSSISYILTNCPTLKIGETLLNQSMVGTTSQDVLNKAMIAMIIASSAISVYAVIRCNWIAFVPMLAGSFLLPLLILGISSMTQVKFDQFVVLCFALVTVVNSIVCLNMLGNTNEAWSRRDAYTNDEFRFIANTAMKNNWTYIWTLGLGYLLFLVCFSIFAPYGFAFGILLMIIGALVTLLVAPIGMTFLLYQFMKVRNFALGKRASHVAKKVVVNYDEIDEQELEGINKFTKRIPVAKEQPKPQGETK